MTAKRPSYGKALDTQEETPLFLTFTGGPASGRSISYPEHFGPPPLYEWPYAKTSGTPSEREVEPRKVARYRRIGTTLIYQFEEVGDA